MQPLPLNQFRLAQATLRLLKQLVASKLHGPEQHIALPRARQDYPLTAS